RGSTFSRVRQYNAGAGRDVQIVNGRTRPHVPDAGGVDVHIDVHPRQSNHGLCRFDANCARELIDIDRAVEGRVPGESDVSCSQATAGVHVAVEGDVVISGYVDDAAGARGLVQ